MEHRHERRALPAGRDVGGPQVVHDRDACRVRQRLPVADLDRQAELGPVQHRLAVEADHRDVGGPQPGLAQEICDRLRMGPGDQRLSLGEDARPGAPVDQRLGGLLRAPQQVPLGCRIRPHGDGTERLRVAVSALADMDAPAVRPDQGGVDAVHGGAAHEPDRPGQALIALHAHLRRNLRRELLHGAGSFRNGRAMSAPTSDFLNVLTERGFIHQMSDPGGIDALARSGRLTTYVGYDCTAPSLHIGHLVSIMMLHWLQATGAGRPIVLMGGGTTRVGDPSGRDETRRILSLADIDANKEAIRQVFGRFLRFGESGHEAAMTDNAEWLTALNYIEFLRDVGRHFSVNRMMSMDSVRLRLERDQELSFIEFNYMLLQSYDFVELNRRYGCVLQMGGSDQWGNIVNGIDLGRRMGTEQLFALTAPLMTTASGAKMGKTAAGAVWLSPDLLAPYGYWQFWRNTEDADVGRFLKLFTALPMAEIGRLGALAGQEINEAKKVLATEATALLHGREAAEAAAATAVLTFEQGVLAADLPSVEHPRAEIEAGLAIGPAVILAGLAASNGEVRRAIANGAISVNDERVADERRVVGAADIRDGVVKLSFGRKRHVLLRAV